MNWLDAVLILLLILSILGGVRSGLISSLVPFAGLILGLYLSLHFYVPFGQLMSFPQPSVAKWVAFAVILILTLLATYGVARLLTMAVSSLMVGWLDRTLGGVWGLVFGAFFLGAMLSLWLRLFGDSSVIDKSPVATFLLARFDGLLRVLPGEFDAVRNFFERSLQTISG